MQEEGLAKGEPSSKLLPWHEWMLLLVVFVVVVVVYQGAMTGAFVFDDLRLIPNNPQVRLTELTWGNIQNIMTTSRPVAMLSFALNYYVGGYEVAGYHATNIAIHLMAGLFLYLFLKQTMQLPVLREQGENLPWLPLVAASLWLVHPIQTQTVSYIVQRMNGMAVMFYVLGMLLYVRARLANGRWAKCGQFAGCLLAGLLALGSKEIAATFPCLIFLYEWYFFQDLDWRWARRAFWVLAGVVIVFGTLVYLNPQSGLIWVMEKGYGLYDFTMTQRVLTELRVVVLYISLLLFPHPDRLNLDYDFPLSYSLIDPFSTLFSLFLLSGLFLFAVFKAREHRLISFCVLWFSINLIIESSVIPLDLVFEHRLYLSSMMAIVLLILLMIRIVCADKRYGLILLVTTFCVFSIWSWQRNNVWGDSLALAVDCAEKSPGKPRPAYNVACEYAKRGDAEEAVRWLEKVVKSQGFDRWDLIKYDRDLKLVRQTEVFTDFFEKYVPNNFQ